MSFEPKILGFLCNWCSYAGADLAGVSRIQYPPNIRVIRVMCSGRVDPEFIFKALKLGIDGVIITGCHIGDCHYLEGNYEAVKKFELVQKLLNKLNLEKRIRLEWISASEGNRFAEVITNFTNQIKELGPSPLSGKDIDIKLMEKLEALEMAAESYRLRALVGRERKITEQENVYGVKFPKERFDNLFDAAINNEYIRNRILLILEKNPKSVIDLATDLNIDSKEVLNHILVLKGRNQVAMEDIIENQPIYINVMER